MLKIERDKCQIPRLGDAGIAQQLTLPILSRGEIDLEDIEIGIGIAVRKGVQTRSKQDILIHSGRYRSGQLILGVPAACSHEEAKRNCHAVLLFLTIDLKLRAQQRHSNRINVNGRVLEKLMSGTPLGNGPGGTAGASGLHIPSLKQPVAPALTIKSMTFSSNWIVWALLSALFAAATAILAKIGVAHIDSNLATAIRTTMVLVFAWAIALALGKHGELRQVDPRGWLFLTLSGFATGLSWLCYFRALQLGPASRVAPLDKMSVVLVMVFAVLFLGEKMSPAAIAGGVLIAAGAVVMTLA